MLDGCSSNKSQKSVRDEDKEFAELSDEEKIDRFSKLGEQLRGDYIKFVGRGPDSLMLFELVLDKDNRFAYRTKQTPGTVNVDSLKIQFVVRGDGLSNKWKMGGSRQQNQTQFFIVLKGHL
jgi:hypothetical protein